MQKQRGMYKLKKIVSIALTLALIVTMLPLSFQSVAEAASGVNFIFPNEKYDVSQPRITSNDSVDITGSLVGVKEKSITYTVSKILMVDDGSNTNKFVEQVVDSKPEQTANIFVNGTSINIKNIQLYTGLNRITFKGVRGISEVYDSIYIEYRNGPTLQDLQVTMDNIKPLSLEENKATVVASDASKGKDNTDIGIMGVAKNADRVQITIDGKSWTYNVTNTTNWEFYAGPINIKKGTNNVTIRAYNSTQSVETTRMITFFNGNVTFFNVNLDDGTNKVDITTTSKITDTASGYKTITGQVVVPTASLTKDSAGNVVNPTIDVSIRGAAKVPATVTNVDVGTLTTTVNFTYTQAANILAAGANELLFEIGNISTVGLPNAITTARYNLTVANSSDPFFSTVNHLDSYEETMGTSQVLGLSGVTLDGAELSTLPTALEFVVANGAIGDQIKITGIANSSGSYVTYTPAQLGFDLIASESVTIDVGGIATPATRYIYKVSKLPISGAQTIDFEYAGNANVKYSAKISLVYGPYHKFNSIYNGMSVTADTSTGTGWETNVLNQQLGGLAGKLYNVPSSITLDQNNTFLYLNNVSLGLDYGNGNEITLKDPVTAAKSLTMGENKIRLIFRTGTTYYKSEITVTVLPKNLPTVENMFPYGLSQKADPYPTPDYSLFQEKGGIYYTHESELNVFGSFDFLDIDDEKDFRNKVNGDNYKVTIKSPTLKLEYNWNLNDAFTIIGNGQPDNPISGTSYDGLTVIYDRSKKNFSFFIKNVEMPTNGSMVVFTVNVESNLTTAQAELTVMPLNVPYTIVKPMDQKRVLNQNYVDVIINAEGADKVIINKKELKKEQYTQLTASGDKVFEDAFRTTITGLKANKDTKIEFSIVRGDETVKSSFTVRYVPTNIPGAQYMETMKSSHKVFDGALNLSLEKGTSLIRKDYNVAAEFKNQVYTQNNIMFAIANAEDGVVDRHEFETLPANYDFELSLGENIFTGSFPKRFVKSSPVFWIDPGLADDINTPNVYDPIMYGSDPYQFPSPYSEIASFYNRNVERELIPSKVGSLTLSYDSKVTTDAGKVVTVFRFDPQLKQWENIGGVVDEKKRTVTVPFSRFGYYVVAKMSYSYTDVVNHAYARDFIETVFAKGVMNPDQPDTAFGTDMYVSRGEFTRMIVKGLQIPLDYEGPKHFSDLYVPDNNNMNDINANGLWDFRHIETAARKGIVRGIAPNMFGGYNDLQRQDAAVMIAKALNLKLETDRTKIDKDLRKLFQDADSISYYAKASVLAIAKKGFIAGVPVDPSNPETGYMFNPDSFMLRGDAALIMGRVMINNKMLPKM